MTLANPAKACIFDWPASCHNGACGFSFVDGHRKLKKWRDARTRASVRGSNKLTRDIASPNNRDMP
jgi:prepilin-type processing-associated H-X9-DG protein